MFIRKILSAVLCVSALTGCGTKVYYEEQTKRDYAESRRVESVARGFSNIAQAVFTQTVPAVPVKAAPPSSCRVRTRSVVGKPIGEQAKEPAKEPEHIRAGLPANAEIVVMEERPDGTFESGIIEFLDEEDVEPVQPQPVQPQQVQPQQVQQSPVFIPQATGEGLLLQYLLAERTASAERLVAEEKTKQVQAIIAGYTQAVLKEQTKQAAPFDPTVLGVEAIRQTPLGLAIWGLKAVGTAGVAGARGDTSNNTETTTTVTKISEK